MVYIPIYSKFIAGNSLKNAIKTSKKLKNKNVNSIFDFAVESNTHKTRNIDEIFKQINKVDNQYIALKFSALGIDNIKQSKYLIDQFYQENKIKKYPNQFLIDAEYQQIQNNINLISNYAIENYNTIQDKYFYKTLQMYRTDHWNLLLDDIDNYMRKDKYALKLVRGAYLKTDKRYNIINPSKLITDNQYNKAIEYFFYYLNYYPNNQLIIATHNPQSYQLGIDLILKDYEKLNTQISFATLLGMADNLCYQDANKFNKIKYIPYGPLFETTPYLLRRLIENKNMIRYIL